MKSIMKRSLALVLTAAMLLSMLAVPAFAADHNHAGTIATELDNDPCAHVASGEVTAVEGETIAATCSKVGGTWMSCPECHDTWIANPTPIDPNAHDYEETVTAPTCQKKGFTAKVCKHNPAHKIDETNVENALGPNYRPTEESIGSCITDGVITYVCTNEKCDCPELIDGVKKEGCKEYTTTVTADGHEIVVVEPEDCAADADDDLIYIAPTCTENGTITFVCEHCDEIWNVEVAKKGHNLTSTTPADATCLETGMAAGKYCTNFVDADRDGHADKDENGNVILCSHVEGDVQNEGVRGEAAFVTPVLQHNPVNLTGKIRVVEVEGKLYLTDDTTVEEIDAYYGGKCAPAGGTPELGYQYKRCDKGCGEVTLVEGVAPEHVPYDSDTDGTGEFEKAYVVVLNDCDNWGYTQYTCSVCGENGEELRDNYVAPEHTYLPTASGNNKIVYTYKEVNEDGTTKWGENGKPIYKTDATGAIFYNYTGVAISGYAAVAWIENVAPMCDVQANFVHDCIKCDHGLESLKFTLEHILVAGSETFHPATCTEDAFYTANCANDRCPGYVDGYKLDIELPATGPADGPIKGTGETVSYKALGHLRQDNTRSANGQLIAASDPDCTNPGNTEFYACFDANCTVPTLKAAAAKVNPDGTANVVSGDTAYLAPNGHNYTGTKAYAATCDMPSFKVVACSVCDVEKWNTDPASVATSAWEARIPASVGFDGDATGEHEYEKVADGTPSTCVDFGTEDLWECKYCGVASTEVGQRGSAYKTAKKPYVQAQYTFDITCNAPGYVYNYCQNCVDADILVWDDVQKKYVDNTADSVDVPAGHEWTFDHEFGIPNADEHVIKGAVYLLDDNGNRVVRNGRFVILNFSKDPVTGEVKLLEADMSTVIVPSTSYTGPSFTAKDGGCDDRTDDAHQNAYECATCGEAFLASVYLEHTYDKTATPTCENSVDCSACGKVILDKVGHDWQLQSTVNFDCLVDGYEIWKCSFADCTYTDAANATAVADQRCDTTLVGVKYVFTAALAAPGHTYDLNAVPTCEKAVVCSVATCGAVIHAATNHNEDAGVYTKPTCVTNGYTTYTCSNENCDYPNHQRVVYDAPDSTLGHNFTVTKYQLERDADCLVFGYAVAFCYNCHEEYEIDYYEADWGHTIAVDTLDPTCERPGKTVEYCTVCNGNTNPIAIDENYTVADWAGVPAYKDVTATTEGMEQLDHENEFGDKLEENCAVIRGLLAKYKAEIEEGTKTADQVLTCVNGCNHKYTEDEGHQWAIGYQEQSCTEQGVEFKYCEVEGCDKKDIISVVDPLGHGKTNGTEWVVDVNASCTTEGHKYLKCLDCNQAVALGEPLYNANGNVAANKVTDTIPAEGHGFKLGLEWVVDSDPTCTEAGLEHRECLDCGVTLVVGDIIVKNGNKVAAVAADVTATPAALGHEFTVVVPGSYVAPTIYANGQYTTECVRFSDCGATKVHTYGDDCDDVDPAHPELKKLEGVLVSGEFVNANAADALITNKSVIAYTVYIEGDNDVVDMITIRLNINPDELIYVGYALPQIDATTKGNIFGTTFGAGSASTSVGVNNEGRVIVFAENSTGEDVVVGEKSALVTLYFQVNAEVIGAKGGKTSVTIELDESAKGTGSMVDVEELDVFVDDDADVIEINKLGDLNGDGYINIVDLKAIKAIILEGGYDARADIDQDGFVDNFDRLAVLDYILTDDYAAFLAYKGAEAYAL